MIIQFERNGRTFKAEVIARGFFKVDAPESYEVVIGSAIVHVAVTDAQIIEGE